MIKLQLEKRRRLAATEPTEALIRSCFPRQADFVRDTAQSLAALCTRRAGKTHASAVKLLIAGYNFPGSTPLYLALTRKSAEMLLWPKLKKINQDYRLGIKFTDTYLIARMPNGSEIHLSGADQKNLIERYRGWSIPAAVIDEAGSFHDKILTSLIDDVLQPATMDYGGRGQITLIGTPPPLCSGYFYRITTEANSEFITRKWSWRDNIFLRDAEKFVSDLLKRKNWTTDNPTYRREYEGEWTQDSDALVYRFSRANIRSKPQANDWQYVVGVDYGWHDATAISVVAFSVELGRAHIVEAQSYLKWIPSNIAYALQARIKQYNPIAIVADTGGLGKSITEEFRKRYGIPVVAADKTEKFTWISYMNDDFVSGKLTVEPSLSDLVHQYQTLALDDNGMEDQSLPNDLCDSCLYAFRKAFHYWHKEPVILSESERIAQKEQEMLESVERQIEDELEDDFM